MQLGFYFDQSRCSNCLVCVVACKDWNDIPAGLVFWRRVFTIEEGSYPDPSVSFLSTSCHHCEEAPCVSGCPVEAIVKREADGIVVVISEACLGLDSCGDCLDVCPYGAPQFGPEPDAKMQKCDLCLVRWAEGKKPICVEACPMRALDAGPLNELESKYVTTRDAQGFTVFEGTKPSIVFKAKD